LLPELAITLDNQQKITRRMEGRRIKRIRFMELPVDQTKFVEEG